MKKKTYHLRGSRPFHHLSPLPFYTTPVISCTILCSSLPALANLVGGDAVTQ